jgi:hypothetical protein
MQKALSRSVCAQSTAIRCVYGTVPGIENNLRTKLSKDPTKRTQTTQVTARRCNTIWDARKSTGWRFESAPAHQDFGVTLFPLPYPTSKTGLAIVLPFARSGNLSRSLPASFVVPHESPLTLSEERTLIDGSPSSRSRPINLDVRANTLCWRMFRNDDDSELAVPHLPDVSARCEVAVRQNVNPRIGVAEDCGF